MNILKSCFSFLLLLGILFFAACTAENPCENVVCQNGGVPAITINGGCGCDCSGTLYTGLACSEFDPDEIQTLLNDGISPKELLDGGIMEELLYGKMYQGGLIFHVDPNDGTGLVAATEDQSDGMYFNCGTDFLGTADLTFIGIGALATNQILQVCDDDSPAKLCAELQLNGYNDWFLPSTDELAAMWARLADLDGNGINSGSFDPNNIGKFERAYYWSANEYPTDAYFMVVNSFQDGDRSYKYKDDPDGRVRAARAF
ncbi:MAG: hypothetical protein AAFO69_21515 [Bacteroidota bacterium]